MYGIYFATQWRQREFKVGGRSAEKVGRGERVFLFGDLEMAYYGEF